MLREFNILDREQTIHAHCLLQASAGTGKTYAVENLVVRLLLEKGPDHAPLSLDQILVVTFTRAAARDLKYRIHSKILESLEMLSHNQAPLINSTPDYIQKILQTDNNYAIEAKKYLERALYAFDQAQIYTIHGFCHRALLEHVFESGISLDTNLIHIVPSTEKMLQLIQDYFRTQIHTDIFSHAQFFRQASTQESLEILKKKLLSECLKGGLRAPLRDFKEQFHHFCKIMSELKQKGYDDSSKIIADFETQSTLYKGILDKKGRIKKEHLAKVTHFANLFDALEWSKRDFDRLIEDGLYLAEVLQPENMKIKKQPTSKPFLHYSNFISDIQLHLMPLITEARDNDIILMRMAYHCQKYLQRYLDQEEIKNYDSLLTDMQKAISQPAFIDLISKKYKATIIDEFQDTDPIQWDIFEKLFFSQSKGYLYLVGDPKQAIYSFRQGDIYTYLKAGNTIGSEQTACLNTNYRSQAKLVNGLNLLFSLCPQFIHLPRLNSSLVYEKVKASDKIILKEFKDGKGSLHFFTLSLEKKQTQKQLELIEQSHIFPFIIHEIVNLYHQGLEFNGVAILVADRYQCDRVCEALKSKNIPYLPQHIQRLVDSPSINAFRELIAAVIAPKNESAVKIALGGPIIGCCHERIQKLLDPSLYEEVLLIFFHFHNILFEEGLIAFINEFMEKIFPSFDLSITENLLQSEGGLDLYRDLIQLIEILVVYERDHPASPISLIHFLDNFQNTQSEEENGIKKKPNPDQKGVNILTTHSSKGLEYEVVFALGLAKRPSKTPDKKRLDISHYPPLIVPILDEQSTEYLQVCEEADAEKMRLLYVALTRAKQRVYIPLFFSAQDTILKYGMCSPIELFIARLGQENLSYKEAYERIQNLNFDEFFKWLEPNAKEADITWQQLSPCLNEVDPFPIVLQTPLIPPETFTPKTLVQLIYSYSSLSKLLSVNKKIGDFNLPHDWTADTKNPHTLPSSSEVGSFLHNILELVPLGPLNKNEIKRIIAHELRDSTFSSWIEVIEQIIFNALTCPLAVSNQIFTLTDINPQKIYREMEFLFPWEAKLQIEGFETTGGFLKGVIDLLFEYKGKYYIIDWKSNWLGPSVDAYSQENLLKAMHEHHYFLQAKIYQNALKIYLKNRDPQPFEVIFGGVIYIFLRGLTSLNSSFNPLGIYFIDQLEA